MRGADDRILEARRPGRGLSAMLIGCLCAAALGSEPLANWARNLPDTPVAQVIQPATENWHAAMETIGFSMPYRWLRATFRSIEGR